MTYDEYCEKEYYIVSAWFEVGDSSGLKYIYENKPIKIEVMVNLDLYEVLEKEAMSLASHMNQAP